MGALRQGDGFTTGQSIGMGADLLGGLIGASSEVQSGESSQRQAIYSAQVLRQNAELEERTAREIREQADFAIQQRGLQTVADIGVGQAQAAGAGVVVNQDSIADAVSDAIRAGTLDKIMLNKNAQRQAMAAKIRATSFRDQASNTLTAGSNIASAGLSSATGTLLATAGSVAGKWASFSDYNSKED
tara:strand:- start:2611 stop:3171 length:561 start_codon:yes stop_codon:yes gene_type:complete